MENFIRVSLIIHVSAGCLALLSGLAAILLRKKVALHRKAGKLYFWCMTVIFVTALYLSVYRHNLFLFFIGVFTFHASATAYRSLKLKQLHLGQKPLLVDWLIEYLNVAANLGLFGIGAWYFMHNEVQWGVICLFFGSIGLRGSYHNTRRLRGRVQGTTYWLIAHISGMVASYIGAITAFTVNNNRWMGLPNVVAWLAPTILLVPFIIYETSRLKPKKAAV